jgi:tetratricopeptide (TPR) repeat protein
VLDRRVLGLACGVLTVAAWPAAARALDVAVGDPIDDAELATISGEPHRLLGPAGTPASVVLFFRADGERSRDTLRDVAACERELAARPVHWVAVVSDSDPADRVRAVVADAGIRMPVLVDRGDRLYGRLGVRLHPTIVIVDGKRRLAAYEPFRSVNYCDRVRARIRLLLGEIDAAEAARVEAPDAATTRTDAGVARRHLSFARSLFRLERHDKALAEVEKSLAVAPSAEAHALQGRILATMGRCAEALRALDTARGLDPKNAEAEDARKVCAGR